MRNHAAPLTLALLIAALALLGDPVRTWLSFDRLALERGEVWRLVTNAAVHLGIYHCLLNLLGLAALLALCPQPLPAREWLRRLVCVSLFTSAGLYLWVPDVGNYVGLSGVLHGLFILGLVPMARRRDLVASGCLLYLLGKLAWEFFTGAPVSDAQAIGGRVVTEAHLLGTLAGLIYGLALGSFRSGSLKT
ncbi:MAG: rhombosortase [Panacagrimonas sp.]